MSVEAAAWDESGIIIVCSPTSTHFTIGFRVSNARACLMRHLKMAFELLRIHTRRFQCPRYTIQRLNAIPDTYDCRYQDVAHDMSCVIDNFTLHFSNLQEATETTCCIIQCVYRIRLPFCGYCGGVQHLGFPSRSTFVRVNPILQHDVQQNPAPQGNPQQ